MLFYDHFPGMRREGLNGMPQVLLLLFCQAQAMDHEIRAWNSLRRVRQDIETHLVEVADEDALESEHTRLLDEGWELLSIGNGAFRNVMIYVRERSITDD
jgi:hypothetical protein